MKRTFSPKDEFIFLFDSCVDKSFDVAVAEAQKYNFNFKAIFPKGEELFEIKANNKILKAATNDIIILFQDDIICYDDKIREKIFNIIKNEGEFGWGLIGGRTGFNIKSTAFPEQTVDRVSNWEHNENQYGERLGEGDYKARTFLNRGPLVFTRRLIEKVGYLDEAYFPQWGDDMDYCARARFEYGLTNIVFECKMKSLVEWGGTRKSYSKLRKGRHFRKNWDLFIERWGKYLV